MVDAINSRSEGLHARENFISAHAGMGLEELALKMKAEGLYSAKTSLCDIRCTIRSFRKKQPPISLTEGVDFVLTRGMRVLTSDGIGKVAKAISRAPRKISNVTKSRMTTEKNPEVRTTEKKYRDNNSK